MSRAVDVALKSVENQYEKEASGSKFSARMKASVKDVGQVGTVRHTILTYVATEGYAKATEELNAYILSKAAFPQFEGRVERYVSYANDLINGIKAKRSFPGFQHLSMSKQQDLSDRAMDHFEDLKLTLRKIESIEKEIRLEDMRSTVLVVKAVMYCCLAMLIIAFLKEISRGVLPTAANVFDSLFGNLVDKIFNMIGI
jgi:hypothetical protein